MDEFSIKLEEAEALPVPTKWHQITKLRWEEGSRLANADEQEKAVGHWAVCFDLWPKIQEHPTSSLDFLKAYAKALVEVKKPKVALKVLEDASSWLSEADTGPITHEMGSIAAAMEKWSDAREFFEKAISCKEAEKQPQGSSWHGLATAFFFLKQYNDALHAYEQAVEFNFEEGDMALVGDSFFSMRHLLHQVSTPVKMLAYYDEWLKDTHAAERKPLQAYVLMGKAMAYNELGKKEDEMTAYEEALALRLQHNITYELGDNFYLLSILYDEQRESKKALEYALTGLEKMLDHQGFNNLWGALNMVHLLVTEVDDHELKTKAAELLQRASGQGYEMTFEKPEEPQPNLERERMKALFNQLEDTSGPNQATGEGKSQQKSSGWLSKLFGKK